MASTAKEHDSGFGPESKTEGAAVHTKEGTIRERLKARGAADPFHISDKARKEYGIQDNETPYWARDSERVWKDEPKDRILQLKEECFGRMVYKNDEYDKVRCGSDLVLMAIPTEYMEVQEEERQAARSHFERDLIPDSEDPGIVRSHRDLFDRLDATLDLRMREEHERNKQSGFVGGSSPTQGMTLMQAEAYARAQGVDIERMQAEIRRGGRHVHMDHEEFTKIVTGDRAARAAAKGRTVAMGESGFPRNPNSAVAQAARRQAPGGR